MLVAGIATEGQEARSHHDYARASVTAGRVNSPILSAGRELDPRRRKRGVRDGFLTRFVTFALDPIAVALEEMFNGAW